MAKQPMNTKEIVLRFFDEKGGMPGKDLQEKLGCHYLDIKIIDSMGIIEMVCHFEEKFKVRFSPEDLQSEEFQTVGGLIQTIEKLRAASS
jgi:acyl carrier protein